MVGLVENQKSVLGLIYWPIKKKMYLAESGKGAFCYNEEWEKIEVTMMAEMQNCQALVSRHHLSEKEKKLLDEMEISVVTSIGSSLKVTEIASGEAEIYITTTDKMKQWDTCASNCIISEAGGKMTDISGNDMVYNTESVNHENGILVTNGIIILSFVPWSKDWYKRKSESKWKNAEKYGAFKKGYIGLQDHDSPLWFRNIKIRKL